MKIEAYEWLCEHFSSSKNNFCILDHWTKFRSIYILYHIQLYFEITRYELCCKYLEIVRCITINKFQIINQYQDFRISYWPLNALEKVLNEIYCNMKVLYFLIRMRFCFDYQMLLLDPNEAKQKISFRGKFFASKLSFNSTYSTIT